MKDKILALIFIAIIFLGGLAGILIQAHHNTLPNENDGVYSGKILFEDRESLAGFKMAIAQKDVKIFKCDEINSDYPVVVSFSVEVPYGKDFHYGDYKQYPKDDSLGYVFGGIFIMCAGIVFVSAKEILTNKKNGE